MALFPCDVDPEWEEEEPVCPELESLAETPEGLGMEAIEPAPGSLADEIEGAVWAVVYPKRRAA